MPRQSSQGALYSTHAFVISEQCTVFEGMVEAGTVAQIRASRTTEQAVEPAFHSVGSKSAILMQTELRLRHDQQAGLVELGCVSIFVLPQAAALYQKSPDASGLVILTEVLAGMTSGRQRLSDLDLDAHWIDVRLDGNKPRPGIRQRGGFRGALQTDDDLPAVDGIGAIGDIGDSFGCAVHLVSPCRGHDLAPVKDCVCHVG